MNNAFKKFDLTGKTALVTGGATGLGYEMTKALVQSGAKVMMAARRVDVLKDSAEKIMSELSVDTVLYHQVDLLDRRSVKALADHAISTFDGVDIFIGNAGLDTSKRIDNIDDVAMDQVIRVNLTANIELTREFLPHMRKKKWGRIIYSSSAGSVLSSTDDFVSVYGAAKSGLNAFTKYVAGEAGCEGITANALILGIFMTAMLKDHLAAIENEQARRALMDSFCSMVALRRPGQPEEVTGLIQLLASDAGSYISGACIPIDGGYTAMLRPSSLRTE